MGGTKITSVLLALFVVLAILMPIVAASDEAVASDERVRLYYLYSHECLSCEQSWPLVQQAIAESQLQPDLTQYDITTREGAEFARAHGIVSVPAMVFDDGTALVFEQCGNPHAFEAAIREKLRDIGAHKPPLKLVRNVTESDSVPGGATVNTVVSHRGDRPLEVSVNNTMPEGSVLVSGPENWTGTLQPGESRCITCTYKFPHGTRLIPPLTATYEDERGPHSIMGPATQVILLQELSALTVYLAGLVAGINPCLLAVMAFIATTTISDTGNRGGVLWRIAAFCGGILAIYLLIGIGLMGLIQRLPIVEIVLRTSIIAVLAILSAWSFLDAWRTKKGHESKAFRSVLGRIRPIYDRFGPAASFVIGGAFGLVKMPCVGGIYIAILGAIMESGQAARGIPLLISYNLGVITPVLLLGALITVGLSPRTVNQFRLRHRVALKIFTGVLLGLMAGAFMLGVM